MKKYIITLITLSLLAIIGLVGMNFIVNPFGTFNSPKISHLNKIKSEAGHQERGYKISTMKNIHPDVLVLGTSREDFGINPKDIPINGVKFNGATTSQPYRESRLSLEYLSKNDAYPKHILLGLLFEISDVNIKIPSDFNEAKLYGEGITKFSELVSLDTVKSSIKTVKCNFMNSDCPKAFYKNGLKVSSHFNASLEDTGQHKQFVENEKHYIRDNHYPLPLCQKHPFIDKSSGYSRMDEIRALLRLAYSHGADLKMFIGPSHARQWETIKVSGLWGKFEEWKILLVKINEEEARKANAVPFSIWDFSGYNTISSENVPNPSDKNARMKYYFESSHYTPKTGALVVQKIYAPASSKAPLDFGVQIYSENLSKHLESLRKQQTDWESEHISDVLEINNLKKEVDAMKKCP